MNETKKCPYCQETIASLAQKCPHCQTQLRWSKRHPFIATPLAIFGGLVILGILGSIVGGLKGNSSPETQSTPTATQTAITPPISACGVDNTTLKQQAQKVDYKELKKSPDSFTNKLAVFTGRVLQIQESDNQGIIRLAVTKDSLGWNFNDTVYVTYEGHADAVEDDIITTYGKLTGSKTYESQAHYEITVPSMISCTMEKAVSQAAIQPKTPTPPTQSPKTSPSPITPTPTASPTPSPTTPPPTPAKFIPPTTAKLGIRTETAENIYTFVGRPEDFSSDSPDKYYQPDPGNKFIDVYIQIDNQSGNPVDYNPAFFKAVDPSGGSYELGFKFVKKSPKLSYGTLNPSTLVSGYVIFEVPADIPTPNYSVHMEGYSLGAVDFK